MKENKKAIKKPMSENGIYKNMMIAVLSVAALFFVKNIIGQAWTGAIVIGACLRKNFQIRKSQRALGIQHFRFA